MDKLGSGFFFNVANPPPWLRDTHMRSDCSMWWKCDQIDSHITEERTIVKCSKLVPVCSLHGCVRLNIWHTVKVKRSNVRWKLSTKTSSICRKRCPIVEIYPSRSPDGTVRSVKIYLKVYCPLTISPKCCPPYRKSWSLNMMVNAVFLGRKQN